MANNITDIWKNTMKSDTKMNCSSPQETQKPIVALCYDFDKTLSPQDMQNYSFIPSLGIKPKEFWNNATKFTNENKMDGILAYMYLMIEQANKSKKSITRADLQAEGKKIELFKGVTEWFDEIGKVAVELNMNIEHYIISSGIKEMIEGTPIAQHFTKIYASEFLYSPQYHNPIWAKQVVNASNKTQYLFRINKGCLDENDSALNASIKNEDRHIPFQNIIYIGDSFTDIPCMSVTKRYGGYSIGVYNPEKEDKRSATQLIKDNRVDYCVPADYTKGKDLFEITKTILDYIAVANKLLNISKTQKKTFSKSH
jgi:phosphoserine phosphatase